MTFGSRIVRMGMVAGTLGALVLTSCSGGSHSNASTGGSAGYAGAPSGGTGGSTGGTGTAGSAGSSIAGAGGNAAGAGGVANAGAGGVANAGAAGTANGGAAGSANGGAGGGASVCTVTALGPTRGSAIALTPDERRLVVVNRDTGTITVMTVGTSGGLPTLTAGTPIVVGAEPWQVAIDGCGKKAYVVLRADQKVVEIDDLDANPVRGNAVSVGSEPTGIAISPNNRELYVSNWVDGTLTRISLADPAALSVTGVVDLNATLVGTQTLGSVTARAALAHPRAVAVTNDGDTDDTDESIVVTEWFAQRTAAEATDGLNADTDKEGFVYSVDAGTATALAIPLPAVADTSFSDHTGRATGCYPNQLGSVTIDGGYAYVTSTCASPVGPWGVYQKGACITNANCGASSTCVAGACTGSCAVDADCGIGGTCSTTNGTCAPNPTDVRTMTHPALSIVDLTARTATTTVLDAPFAAKSSTRMPLLPTDVGFENGSAYLAAEGTDAVFRVSVSGGAVSDVGSATGPFIDLQKGSNAKAFRLPVGIAVSRTTAFAFVANLGTRDVAAVDLTAGAVAVTSGQSDYRIAASDALPSANSPQARELDGKRFFTTGLGRWSLDGAGWSSCAACHIDGSSDNVTWYAERGPRQTISLDGSFNSNDNTDRRIFGWTARYDEIADFEDYVRNVEGGVGALVSTVSTPPALTDRIDLGTESPPELGLQGSSADIADPNGTSAHPHSVIADWLSVDQYIRKIRSPRRPTNLLADLGSGRNVFMRTDLGNCVGCHSGPKWTISEVFYMPGDVPNDADGSTASTSLSRVSWNSGLNGFPSQLWPVDLPNLASAFMRFGAAPASEQIQCILRPAGTYGVAPSDVGIAELRQNMTTASQGNAATGRGYNPPSLLGLSVGAPFFHAGNARTLEEAFDAIFTGHHQSAVAPLFAPTAYDIQQLTQYLLSIDENESMFNIPAKGVSGGDLCFYP